MFHTVLNVVIENIRFLGGPAENLSAPISQIEQNL